MTTALAKRPRVLRRAVGSVVVDTANYERWHAIAAATEGLSSRETGVLGGPVHAFQAAC
jgi:hypothetical protein